MMRSYPNHNGDLVLLQRIMIYGFVFRLYVIIELSIIIFSVILTNIIYPTQSKKNEDPTRLNDHMESKSI